MARPGPAPEPTALKKAKGTDRADRRARHEPPADGKHPRRPPGLRPTARGCWDRLIPALAAKGILDGVDEALLAVFCETWARWIKVTKVLQAKGETYESVSQNGGVRVYKRPEVQIEHDLAATLRSIAGEFGMSASSRSRIEVPQKDPVADDGKGKFFGVVG